MLIGAVEPNLAVYVLVFFAALWAGAQNALAGGGSFITLPVLMMTGLDAKAANIASAVALFPSQLASGWRSRAWAGPAGRLTLTTLVLIGLLGGAIGAVVLLLTPTDAFERLIPFLVLFATCVFAWGSFGPRPKVHESGHPIRTAILQFAIGVYGGYFGGGNGFLMMAVLTLAGQGVRMAGATKNVINVAMNLTAMLIFLFMAKIAWLQVAIAGSGAFLGSLAGVWLLGRLDERVLRVIIIAIGVALSIGLFVRGGL